MAQVHGASFGRSSPSEILPPLRGERRDGGMFAVAQCVVGVASSVPLDGLPDYIYCNVQLTAAYMLAGEEEKARTQAKQVLRVNPGFSVETSVVVRRINRPNE